MIVVLKDNPDRKQLDNLVSWLKSMGLDIHFSKGNGYHNGPHRRYVDCRHRPHQLSGYRRYGKACYVQEPYENVNRKSTRKIRSLR